MDGTSFQTFASEFLFPFIRTHYPNYHQLHMDNAPTHTALETEHYLVSNGMNVSSTSAQSPDLNPIELVWNDLKYYLSCVSKPTTKQELIDAINQFWTTFVTVEFCNSKIDHIQKVLHEVLKVNGKATGL